MYRWLPLVALLLTAAASARIYKWVDAEGTVHYGDKPEGRGARVLRSLPALSTYGPPSLPKAVTEEKTAPEKQVTKTPAASATSYKVLELVGPEDQAVIHSPPGNVQLFVAVDPKLAEGDRLGVILDGKVLPARYSSTVIQLQNLNPGQHTVAVAIYRGSGTQVKASQSHTFYLYRIVARKVKKPRPGT